jgi:TctA family transporter
MGPIIENNLNRALVVTQGDFLALVTRPITLTILIPAVVTAVLAYRSSARG